MLVVEDVSAGYESGAVIHSVSLDVRAGEIVALIGANGAGKSTLAKAISGTLPLMAGRLHFQNKSIAGLSSARRVKLGLVHVPEGRQIFAGLTVEQNLELGAYSLRLTGEAFRERLEAVYRRFPALRPRARDVAGNLSGGQQQMLAIGRALMADPRLLILDEPSLGLSPALVKEIFALIADLRAQGLAILLSEQNARMSLAVADRGYVMENGRVTVSASAGELAASDDIASRYLGLGPSAGEMRADAEFERRFVAAMRV
jgi:branched-chain amino acid transport system ATP-binding protein